MTVISERVKSVDAWDSVKVMAAVSPAFSEETSEERAMVGGSLSTLTVIFAVLVSAESVASTVRMCCEQVS